MCAMRQGFTQRRMMNANARKWVEALRSGRYKQGRNRLRTEYGYCCLGVACEVYRRETGGGIWEEGTLDFHIFDGTGRRVVEKVVLPDAVSKWLGLVDRAGFFEGGALTNLNDSGTPFDGIANVIESEPPMLFVKEV